MRCYNCGSQLTCIDHGGCGGNGGLEGCENCDALYRLEGGGIISGAHPVLDRYGSFAEARFRHAQQIKPHKCDWDYLKEKSPEIYGKWAWKKIGEWENFYTDTEEDALQQIKQYIEELHAKLNWPTCDKCGKKPREKIGVGQCYICRDCNRVCYGKQWFDRNPEAR